MKRWVIKHRPSGFYIPEPRGWYDKRGGSFSVPDPDENKARLFISELSAKRFLSAWLKGEYYGIKEYEDGYWYTAGYKIKDPPVARIKEDMEILPVGITLP